MSYITPFYPISQVRKARHWRVLWRWQWFVYLPKSRDSNPTSLASESTLLPGMFHWPYLRGQSSCPDCPQHLQGCSGGDSSGSDMEKAPAESSSKKNQGLHPEHLPQLGYLERVLDSKAEGLFKFLTLRCPAVGPLGPSINPRFLVYPMRVTPTSLKNRRDPGFPACQWWDLHKRLQLFNHGVVGGPHGTIKGFEKLQKLGA